MSNDRSADDDGDEYWQRVHDDDDPETGFEPTGVDPGVKTDPDDVREWAEERDAVPVTDPAVDGPEAYALRRDDVIEGSAHEQMSWQDFAAAFRGETRDEGMEFHHHDDDEAGTHRFVSRGDDRGVSGTAEDEGRSDAAGTATATDADTGDARADADRSGSDAEVDIGGVETEAGSDHDDAAAADDEGTVVGDREGGIESGSRADADASAVDADAEAASAADWSLDDVSEGDTVIDSEGETAGIVTAVEADALYVDPDPGITEKLSAKLGWVDEDDAEYTVDADDVAGVENGDVHLKSVSL